MKPLSVQKASAGSGKTYQLAYTYIRLALGENGRLYYPDVHHRHREILAVTFTNKATEEMKQRIIRELRHLSDPEASSDYRKDLLREFSTDTLTLAKAAAQTLTDILFDYGNFSVSTIDAFFQRVLRSFAYEAELSGNYEVELDEETVNEQAVADTLNVASGITKDRQRDTRELYRWVKEHMKQLQREGKSFTLMNPSDRGRTDLVNFVNKLQKEIFKSNRDSIMSVAQSPEAMHRMRIALEDRRKDLMDAVVLQCDNILATAFPNISYHCKNAIAKIKEGVFDNTRFAYLEDIEKGFKKDVSVQEVGAFEQLAVPLRHHVMTINSIDAVLSNLHSFGIFASVLYYRDRFSADNNIIVLGDTNSILHQIIDGSPQPFIYEKIGQRYRHFLIDEFQDTSRLQWANFKPLLAESLGHGDDNLIIGDVKQSIYRFRDSDANLLARDIEADSDINRYISVTAGSTNYRSSKTVVEFNNALFQSLAADLQFSDIYSSVRQNVHRKDLDGYVSFQAVGPKEDSVRLSMLLEGILRQIDHGYSPSDIVVLCRSNRDGAKVVTFLLDNLPPHIKVMSDEALLLRSSRAVNHIVERLCELDTPRWEEAPSDSIYTSQLDMVRFEQRLLQLRRDGISPEDALQQCISEQQQSGEYRQPIAVDPSTSLFDTIEQIVATMPDCQWLVTDAHYISAFQDLVQDYCKYGNPTLHGFLDHWKSVQDSASVGISAGSECIRVLTIHKSKGLEFPCVHIPFGLDALYPDTEIRWYDSRSFFDLLGLECDTPDFFPIATKASLQISTFADQYAQLQRDNTLDALNVIYVAMTRAVRELSVIVGPPSKAGSLSLMPLFSNALSSYIGEPFDLAQTGLFESGKPTTCLPAGHETPSDDFLVGSYHLSRRSDPWAYTRIDPEEMETDVKLY